MVYLKPYVHWKINNEAISYDDVDPNYLWATVVESKKGPINTPIICESNAQVQRIFGADMSAYFAQGAKYLVVVRAAAQSVSKQLQKAKAAIHIASDFVYKYVAQPRYVKNDAEYEFESYANDQETLYATGHAKTTGKTKGTYAEIVVKDNTIEGFTGNKYFIDSSAQVGQSLYELFELDGDNLTTANIYVKLISASGSETIDNGPKKYVKADGNKIPVNNVTSSSLKYKECDPNTGIIKDDAITIYTYDQVFDEKIEEIKVIEAAKVGPVIELEATFEGDYGLELVLYQNLLYKGYNITLTEEGNGYISITNATDLYNIVNRINDQNLNVKATLTDVGAEIVAVTRANPKLAADTTDYSDVAVGQILANTDETENLSINDKNKYFVELAEIDAADSFAGGNNGEWDVYTDRISDNYVVNAHKEALESLRLIKIAGIFCNYAEDVIQRQYILHGTDPSDPYYGMNSNVVCRWRYIVLGANEDDRESLSALKEKAETINDQYVLFMGQGLIDGGVQLLPYQCTPYLAGLRAKLNYGDSIFGGQSRKQIQGVTSKLEIAPLFAYEDKLVWEPLVYTELNEAGVLTFTTEYGQLSFTDGVTTRQTGTEEDEEGVMSILKYIQNGVQNICVGYIGRNIDSDIQAAIEMSITAFLEGMTSTDKTLIAIPDEDIKAYEVEVIMNSRRNQLIGKIYVNLKVTPVHALRQIEVEMTVQ